MFFCLRNIKSILLHICFLCCQRKWSSFSFSCNRMSDPRRSNHGFTIYSFSVTNNLHLDLFGKWLHSHCSPWSIWLMRKKRKSPAIGHHWGIKFIVNTDHTIRSRKKKFRVHKQEESWVEENADSLIPWPIIYWKNKSEKFCASKICPICSKTQHTHIHWHNRSGGINFLSLFCFVEYLLTRSTPLPKCVACTKWKWREMAHQAQVN